MDAGEVNLLNHLPRRGWPRPQRSGKLAATLINRYGMISVLDVRVQRGVEESIAQWINSAEDSGNAEGANCVPYAHHRDRGVAHQIFLFQCRQLLWPLAQVMFAISTESLLGLVIIHVLRGQTTNRNHSGHAARGIGATAEAEQKQCVARRIQMSDSRVTILDF